jgi:hypothetical protein
MAIRYRVLAYRPSQAPSDPAHYYKFGELFHRYKIADAAWPFYFFIFCPWTCADPDWRASA